MSKFYPNPKQIGAFTPEDVATLAWGKHDSSAYVFAAGDVGPLLGFHVFHSEGNSYFSIPVTREMIEQLRAVADDAELALDEFEAMNKSEAA